MNITEFLFLFLLACVIARATCGGAELYGHRHPRATDGCPAVEYTPLDMEPDTMVGAVCPPRLGPQHDRRGCVAIYNTPPSLRVIE